MIRLASHIALLIIAGWLAAMFDLSVAHWLALRQCAPSACLLAASVSVVCSDRRYAFLSASWFGFVADITGVGPMGPAMGSYAVVGFFIIELRQLLKGSLMTRQGFEIVIGATAMAVLLMAVHGLMTPPANWSSQLLLSAGTGVYSAALAIPFVLIAASARPQLQPLAPTL